ncbi:PPE domain-containing protein [Rhodococcus sp. BP-349]|uniref:PPE domain-containing protein n=1 Tax=unclassified Rhodococcus (in: high G+C Gram-positive bacteria) TaxID=192944 RepID=UPI001C9AA02B|nr:MULTISPECIES: PPE domain-containing protein [unclassified Rhodococcus (in: high G+C Gram-positive bacteria)]MBY6539096.1 PPE domain-containing protein [Rhodococcus sp. BP-363]MBY6544576.1 PPE domain-containing protein [Rhodococcus sp. BP-369]MBY6563806.1 PPE domain-containing protein [Rhodococcus sp. BP-370]MBY6578098.1 PPE domain-containing protein [Rhodococcus sp. BP-364]MBY6587399.1 PPE domain-containing protein [Rhodococcus sp. BP-358]
MTAGPTGVFWLPRTAAVNSAALLAGAGPAPLAAAGTAWAAMATALAAATATVSGVAAALATTWDGDAADAAGAGMTAFATWGTGAAQHAAAVSARAAAQSATVVTALAVMPSLPEIAAVKAGRTTAYATGGALTGAAQAADAADAALDVRAALVMEAYEAATAPLALVDGLQMPPQITTAVTVATTTVISAVPGHGPVPSEAGTQPSDGTASDRQGDASSVQSSHPGHPSRLVPESIGHDPAVTRAASLIQQMPAQAGSTLSSVLSSAPQAGAAPTITHVVPQQVPMVAAGWGGGGRGGSGQGGSVHAAGGALTRTPSPFLGSSVDSDPSVSAGQDSSVSTAAHPRSPFGAGLPMGHGRLGSDDVVPARRTPVVVEEEAGVPVVPAVIGARR